MTMPMKQGLLRWSPFDHHFLSRSSISSLKVQKTLKTTSYFFKNFASINDPRRTASNIISYLSKDSENGGSQLKIPTIFDLKRLIARKRKEELQQLNEQLRQINTSLRRQAKIESYAPSLSYVPVSGRITEDEVIVDPRKPDLISRLKNGKKFLRSQEPDKALTEFKTALQLAQNIEDPIEEKKAARGVGASLQRQGNFCDAIKYHSMVLEISQREGEESGSTEAYGAIADCYTELGDLERAAKYYDQYISRLQSD
ncbi:hypothetical protein CASFOL_033424 [Castilleja foliolosa]|uniref:Uncharacterized protein n=1 Tax=Castilleja foliolosa TaxID=1961234 RepID=A0ABD3C0E1_9LAMI